MVYWKTFKFLDFCLFWKSTDLSWHSSGDSVGQYVKTRIKSWTYFEKKKKLQPQKSAVLPFLK